MENNFACSESFFNEITGKHLTQIKTDIGGSKGK